MFMKAEIMEEVKKTDLLTGETLTHQVGKVEELMVGDKHEEFEGADLA